MEKTRYFYDSRASDDVCKAHIIAELPHPEREDDKLIVYRWFGKHKRWWWYGVTDNRKQDLWADYVKSVLERQKRERKRKRNSNL